MLEDALEVVGGADLAWGVAGRLDVDAEGVLGEAVAELGPGAAGEVGLPGLGVLPGRAEAWVGLGGVVEVCFAGSDTLVERVEARERSVVGGASCAELVEDALQVVEGEVRHEAVPAPESLWRAGPACRAAGRRMGRRVGSVCHASAWKSNVRAVGGGRVVGGGGVLGRGCAERDGDAVGRAGAAGGGGSGAG